MQIFANAFPIHYSPPDGFRFEVSDDFVPVQVLVSSTVALVSNMRFLLALLLFNLLNDKLQDNPLIFDYNVELRVNDFIDAAITQVNSSLN